MDAAGARVTRREAEVVHLVGDRLSNDEIASALFVSKRTVESHISALMRKLGVDGRRALAGLARAGAVDGGPAPLPVPAAIDLAVESAPLVGRARERAALERLWDRARGGQVVMAVLTGEAGIGKSRLAADLAVTAQATGADVLLGACYEDQPAALGPFVEAFAEHLGRSPGDDARRRRRAGTERQRCDFGVPKIVTPSTSVADSSIASRRRIGSTLRTRSAASSPKRTRAATDVTRKVSVVTDPGVRASRHAGPVPLTLLIVDDHDAFRALAFRMLAGAEFEVMGAVGDGESALQVAADLHPDVVLLDVNLPGMDGFEIARRLTARDGAPRIVLTSTRRATDYRERIAESPAAGFISKQDLSLQALNALLMSA